MLNFFKVFFSKIYKLKDNNMSSYFGGLRIGDLAFISHKSYWGYSKNKKFINLLSSFQLKYNQVFYHVFLKEFFLPPEMKKRYQQI